MSRNPKKSYVLRAIEILLIVMAISLFFLDRYTALYINNILIHFIVFYVTVTGLALIAVVFILGFRSSYAIIVVLFTTLILCFAVAFFSWGGEWKTQTVLYQHKYHPERTIELRLRGDRFAFGYKKQVVEREKILSFVDRITDVDTSEIDQSQWKRVTIRNNNLKFDDE